MNNNNALQLYAKDQHNLLLREAGAARQLREAGVARATSRPRKVLAALGVMLPLALLAAQIVGGTF